MGQVTRPFLKDFAPVPGEAGWPITGRILKMAKDKERIPQPGDGRFSEDVKLVKVGSTTGGNSMDWGTGWRAAADGEPEDKPGMSDDWRAGHRDFHRLSTDE